MKIVALHTDFRLYWPARLKALANALQQRGDSLHIIEIAGKGSHYAFAQQNNTSNLNWNILFPNDKPESLSGKTIQPKLFNLLDNIHPDVILSGAIAFPSGALAANYGQLRKIPVIVFDDAKVETVKRNPLVNFIKQSVYSGVDAMFYPATDWIETGKFWKFKEQEMFFGVNVVDNDFWSQPTNSDETDKYGKYILSVGRQIPSKRMLELTKSYQTYLNKYTKIGGGTLNLLIIGEGPQRQIIEDYVKENHLDGKVYQLPFLSQNELIKYYHHAQATILSSSSSETWGLTINEAMAGGSPILASNQCGATNILVKEGVNGYRFEHDDAEALTQAIINIHNLSDEEMQRMRTASKRIVADWGLPKFAKGAIEAIDYVATHGKRRTSLLSRLIISLWKGQYHPN